MKFRSFEPTRQMLERLWLKQLHYEYEIICHRYRLDLAGVFIRLSPSVQQWGQWDPLTKTISMNTKLIEEHSWDQVIAVLKHEMAHQIVSEIFRSDDIHGPHFHRACEMLGLELWARKSQLNLDDSPVFDWREQPLSSGHQRLHEKVKKLLAMASSGDDNEAFVAMKSVKEILQQSRFMNVNANEEMDHVTLTINHRTKRLEIYHTSIASILNRHYGVTTIFTSLYDAKICESHKTIDILGNKDAVLLAEYVYWYLLGQLRLMWKHHQKLYGTSGINARNSFYLGILNGFDEKLKKEKLVQSDELQQEAFNQLMVIADQQLSRYVQKKYPRMRTINSGQRRYDEESYQAGQEKGRQLTVHKGLNNISHSPALLGPSK